MISGEKIEMKQRKREENDGKSVEHAKQQTNTSWSQISTLEATKQTHSTTNIRAKAQNTCGLGLNWVDSKFECVSEK